MITEIAKFNKNRNLLYWTSKKKKKKNQFLFPLSTHCTTSNKNKKKNKRMSLAIITEYLKMRGKESEFFVIFISSLYFVFLLLFIFRRGPDVPDRVNV